MHGDRRTRRSALLRTGHAEHGAAHDDHRDERRDGDSAARACCRRDVHLRGNLGQLPAGDHRRASATPLFTTVNSFALTRSHGPVSPPGHSTRTSAAFALPSPKWIQPSCPPAWPPPIVSSRRMVRSPTRTSTHAPIALAFGPPCATLNPSQLPIGRGREASPAPTFRHNRTGAP